MTVKQKKRRWSDEEKRSICFQTMVAGVSVAQVARRYAIVNGGAILGHSSGGILRSRAA